MEDLPKSGHGLAVRRRLFERIKFAGAGPQPQDVMDELSPFVPLQAAVLCTKAGCPLVLSMLQDLASSCFHSTKLVDVEVEGCGGRSVADERQQSCREQHWEFDPDAGTTPEEREEVEKVRREFTENRFRFRQSSDLLMRTQLRKENPIRLIPTAVKIKDDEEVTEEAVTVTLRRAIGFYSSLQAHDGHWPTDNARPLFLFPPLIMALYITGALDSIFTSEHKKETKRYIYNHQNEDGGWGFHIEGHSTMFGSALSYIALRLLGEGPDNDKDGSLTKGREWILNHGGIVAMPSWGKFWYLVYTNGTDANQFLQKSGCSPRNFQSIQEKFGAIAD
ncbi:hypothetical protein MLD38_014156 [Melastoma candidum]|uniref:Uncharacterized protein n=1 Tax=Melastoma candidum TaxID=119954 RepID=A0ACB9RKA2_9MYRT|nr:hypothetical protein MLD38_014156 [Melastoma candidum]